MISQNLVHQMRIHLEFSSQIERLQLYEFFQDLEVENQKQMPEHKNI